MKLLVANDYNTPEEIFEIMYNHIMKTGISLSDSNLLDDIDVESFLVWLEDKKPLTYQNYIKNSEGSVNHGIEGILEDAVESIDLDISSEYSISEDEEFYDVELLANYASVDDITLEGILEAINSAQAGEIDEPDEE